MLSTAWSTLRTRWVAFVGSFIALSCGIALMATALLVISATTDPPQPAQQRYSGAPTVLIPDRAVTLTAPDGETSAVPVAQQPALPATLVAAVAATGPVYADHTCYAQLAGGPADQVGRGWSAAAVGGYRLTAGQAPQAPGQIVVGGGARAQIGTRVTLLTAAGPLTATVSGVTAPVAYEHALFFTDAQAARLCPTVDALAAYGPAAAIRRAVAADGSTATVTVTATDAAAAAPAPIPVRILTGDQRDQADPLYTTQTGQLIDVQTPLGFAAALAGIVSVFVVAGTFALSIAQRRRELALLRLIGATRTQTRRLVYCEALLVGVLAAATGCAAGAGAAPLCGRWLLGRAMVPADFTVPLTWWALPAAALIGLATATAGVVTGALQAGRVHPAEALREADLGRPSRLAAALRWTIGTLTLAFAATALAALAAVQPELLADPANSFTVALTIAVGFIVLAGVLAAPLLRLLTALPVPARRRTDPALAVDPGAAVWSIARRGALGANRRTASVAASVAVIVALAGCLLGSSGAVDGAQAAITRQDLATADYMITPAGSPGLSDALVRHIQAIPGISTMTSTPTTLFTVQAQAAVVGLPAAAVRPADLTAVGGPPLTAGSTANLGPDTVLLDQDWPGSPHVGSQVRLWLADGTPATLTVAGLFRATPSGYQAYLDQSHAGTALPAHIAVRLDPGTDPARALASLTAATRGYDARVSPAGQLLAAADDTDARQARSAILMILGLSVLYALIALADTLVMTVSDRKRELALLRLAGATRGQVLCTVAAETLMCVAAGALVGLLATAASAVGTWAVLRQMTGPGLPLVVPWGPVAALIGVCALVASAAILIPAATTLLRAQRRGLIREAVDGG